jgi:uncharacterized membrane protein YhaH (DUF805 family)
MNWYLDVLKKYAVFQGRARRKEYWMFVLFNILAGILLLIIDIFIGLFGMLSFIYSVGVIIPSLAVCVRRLHDTGRTGWWILIGLIPLIGPIVLLVFLCLDSKPEENQYGPNPKA